MPQITCATCRVVTQMHEIIPGRLARIWCRSVKQRGSFIGKLANIPLTAIGTCNLHVRPSLLWLSNTFAEGMPCLLLISLMQIVLTAGAFFIH